MVVNWCRARTIESVLESHRTRASTFELSIVAKSETGNETELRVENENAHRGTVRRGQAVVPFGFGLSYATFEYRLERQPTNVDLEHVRRALATGRTFVKEEAAPDAEYAVNVTNTGSVAADDVVLGFLSPPDAGADGAPLKELFGKRARVTCRFSQGFLCGTFDVHTRRADAISLLLFFSFSPNSSFLRSRERIVRPPQDFFTRAPAAFERVHLAPGETKTVWLYPALSNFASVALDGTSSPRPGDYTVSFGVEQTAKHGQGFLVAPKLTAA